MASSNRRRDISPPRVGGIGGNTNIGGSGVGSSKLRMDREPVVARISGKLNFQIKIFITYTYKLQYTYHFITILFKNILFFNINTFLYILK